jgi:hypothetical protein
MIQKSSYGYNSKLNWSGERCENISLHASCITQNCFKMCKTGQKTNLIECKACAERWLDVLCLDGGQVWVHKDLLALSVITPTVSQIPGLGHEQNDIPNLFDLGGMRLFRPNLRQMNVPNGSLGHLISELILFAPVPAQLNLKEVPVQVALGGSCFKTLKSVPSRNPSYITKGIW